MIQTDIYAIVFLEALLLSLLVYAVFSDKRSHIKSKNASIKGKVIRGEQSMAAIYTAYGAMLAACLLLIDNASGIDGNKVLLIIVNYVCITYLFFLSSWFRNSVFFPLTTKVKKN